MVNISAAGKLICEVGEDGGPKYTQQKPKYFINAEQICSTTLEHERK